MSARPAPLDPVSRIEIAIGGLGKVAMNRHVPTLRSSGDFELAAVFSPHEVLEGVPSYPDLATLVRERPEVTAVALCTPPQVRCRLAREALEHGLHVLLEKPPAVTVGEVLGLAETAARRGLALFASWHSRHACAVEPARIWLANRRIAAARITWKEDVRVWHPGQAWIWKAGGLGVFDPGINGLSVATRILPHALALEQADLYFPCNCETPSAARVLLLSGPNRAPVRAELDFLQPGEPTWEIEVDTDAGRLRLSHGGTRLAIDGVAVSVPATPEYESLYARFAGLVRGRAVDADTAPLQLVTAALQGGRRFQVEPFVE